MDKKIKKLEKELKETRQEAGENLEGWKRAKADFINYKKRQEELMVEFKKFACENIVEDFITVLDNMDLSIEHIPKQQKDLDWVKGIAHIRRMLEDTLRVNGMESIEVNVGDKFNPEIHEAVESEEKLESEEDSKIKKVLRKGYKLNGKIIRAVKVIVN